MEILPYTKYKIAKHLAHPIGFEIIDKALSDCSRSGELLLLFTDDSGKEIGRHQPGWNNKYLQGPQKIFGFVEVLKIYCASTTGCSLTVRPVERQKKSLTRRALVEVGLGKAVNWISQERPETWFEGRRVLQLGLDAEMTRMCFFETHDARVVGNRVVPLPAVDIA